MGSKLMPIKLAMNSYLILVVMLAGCRPPTRVTSIKLPGETVTESAAEPYEISTAKERGKWLRKPFTEAEIGIPIYPKAKPLENQSFETFIPSQLKGYTRQYIHAAYETNDSYSQVLTWYVGALKELNAKVNEFRASNGMNAILRVDGETDKWVISLQQLEGKHGTLIIIKRVSY
ncbi:MAG: hypothetical protein RMK18_04195 [Armatimonadota bacterium]|nr:hypothetical protein [Armatimonadota bacterium]MCX7778430.1 hypothetical protein [Armatimonadota bacterium]MDW8025050.1 hypothetical protein [Armatimonadota bacterium]